MSDLIYNFPAHKRGDTWRERILAIVTDTDSGDPVPILSARMQVRRVGNREVIHEWSTAAGNMVLTGAGPHIITAHAVAPATTATWPTGNHVYDLEMTLDDSATPATVITAPKGKFPITADVTRNDS